MERTVTFELREDPQRVSGDEITMFTPRGEPVKWIPEFHVSAVFCFWLGYLPAHRSNSSRRISTASKRSKGWSDGRTPLMEGHLISPIPSNRASRSSRMPNIERRRPMRSRRFSVINTSSSLTGPLPIPQSALMARAYGISQTWMPRLICRVSGNPYIFHMFLLSSVQTNQLTRAMVITLISLSSGLCGSFSTLASQSLARL